MSLALSRSRSSSVRPWRAASASGSCWYCARASSERSNSTRVLCNACVLICTRPPCVLSVARPGSRAPDLAGCLYHQLELTPLLVLPQQVASGGRCKAALWTQGQVLDWHVAGCLVNAAPQLILGL